MSVFHLERKKDRVKRDYNEKRMKKKYNCKTEEKNHEEIYFTEIIENSKIK